MIIASTPPDHILLQLAAPTPGPMKAVLPPILLRQNCMLRRPPVPFFTSGSTNDFSQPIRTPLLTVAEETMSEEFQETPFLTAPRLTGSLNEVAEQLDWFRERSIGWVRLLAGVYSGRTRL